MVGKPLTSADPVEIGPYTLVSRLGEGGMGVVYLAEDAAGKRVALKVIRPHLASHDQFLERFRSEVALARKVARFCTAPILDSDTESDPPYIVTEYVDGPTLTAAVADNGPLSGSELHALGVGVASALTAIHRAGIVHRDLKPSNVLLSRYGPRVIDFGIAKAVDAISDITQTGQFVGSPSYTAPERYLGEPMTPLTDIFAWGSVLTYAGTGRQPFGTVTEAIAYRVVHGEPDLEGLDPQLTDLVSWTLSKKPADRPTAQQLLDTLLDQERGVRLPMRPAPSRVTSPPVVDGLTTVAHNSGNTVTAPLPVRSRSTGKLLASVLAVALLFTGAAGGGWYAWNHVKQQRTTGGLPKASATPTPIPAPGPQSTTPAVQYDDHAVTPAPEVPGAKRGGTVTGLDADQLGTLDPQRVYDERTMSVGSSLLYRSLTGYVDDGQGGLKLVGDLATNTGVKSDNGRTWTYTLRDGVAFEDGTPIAAADVAYGVQRAFAVELADGPPYVQNWLVDTPTMSGTAFRTKWKGPYLEPTKVPAGLKVLDSKTIQFTFSRSHPEFPMVAALGTTSPVPAKQDTRASYGTGGGLVASGPYRIASHTDSRLELVRNKNWKPETDPIRHAYPDAWVFRSGASSETATDRILKNAGDYATSFAWSNMPVARNKTAPTEQVLSAPTSPQTFLAINTLEVTNINDRKAINAAIDREVAMARYRDANFGRPSTTILSSAMPGYTPHTALGVGPKGDKALARRLLNGRTPTLKIPYNTLNAGEKRLVEYVESALEEVGFTVELKGLVGREFWDTIENPANGYSLYPYFWGPDIPDGSGVFDHLFDTSTVGQPGNRNTSFLREQLVGAEIFRLQVEPDRNVAAVGYGKLDETILRDYTPIVPLFEGQQLSVFGNKLSGLYVHRVFGTVGITKVWVT